MSRTLARPGAAGAVNRDETAHRRGLVLGLTMAEIMLLLVFCLLIAVAVVFKKDRAEHLEQERQRIELAKQLDERTAAVEDRTRELEAALEQTRRKEAEVKRLTELVEASAQAEANPQQLEEEWRRLILSDTLLQRIKDAGLVPEKLVERSADIQSVNLLLEKGQTGREIVGAVRQAKALAESLSEQDELREVDFSELVRLASSGLERERMGEGEHDWPPIINLSEAEGYSFAVGRAELSADFEHQLKTSIAAEVLANVEKFGATIVEVVGHTDEQPISQRFSNLDKNLVQVLGQGRSVNTLVPADNVGLGMARAVSVASVLGSDPRFKSVTVLPLSGGQLILPGDWVTDGSFGGDSKERRRIEIRVRRPYDLRETKASTAVAAPRVEMKRQP